MSNIKPNPRFIPTPGEPTAVVAYSARLVDGKWRHVLYRPEHEAREPESAPRKPRGLVGTSQGEIGL